MRFRFKTSSMFKPRAVLGRHILTRGLPQSSLTDVYHKALMVSWGQFLASFVGLYVALNLVFATLYAFGSHAVANARPGSFADLFFFSVETSSTTGYGDMHPQTAYAHFVATVEILVSLVATAVMTGLIFARFSRPSARLVFAEHLVVSPYNGLKTLMVRVVNARESSITEATAKLWMLGPSISAEGKRFVGFRPMRLLRFENPAFGLSWTLFHPIDSQSPLYERSIEELKSDTVSIVISLTGLDERSSHTVHARMVYTVDAIKWDHEYIDMFHTDEKGRLFVDFSKINETQLNVTSL